MSVILYAVLYHVLGRVFSDISMKAFERMVPVLC